jgi:hypothetical protein
MLEILNYTMFSDLVLHRILSFCGESFLSVAVCQKWKHMLDKLHQKRLTEAGSENEKEQFRTTKLTQSSFSLIKYAVEEGLYDVRDAGSPLIDWSDWENLEWFMQNASVPVVDWLEEIAFADDVDALEALCDLTEVDPHEILKYAACYAARDIFEWGKEKNLEFSPLLYCHAIANSSNEFVEELYKHGVPLPDPEENHPMLFAAAGNVPMLDWLHEKGFSAVDGVFRVAATYGAVDVLEWFSSRNVSFPPFFIHAWKSLQYKVFTWAAGKHCGHLEENVYDFLAEYATWDFIAQIEGLNYDILHYAAELYEREDILGELHLIFDEEIFD